MSGIVFRAKVTPPRARGLVRTRLLARLDELWDRQVGLVIAPAGAGKTTAITHYAEQRQIPAVWFRADCSDGEAAALVRHLRAALSATLDLPVGASDTVDTLLDALQSLDAARVPRLMVIVDDVHHLDATPAAAALDRLIALAPPVVRVVALSRTPPTLDLSRLRLAEELCEVGADDLRFRSWEVERLFREVYDDPLPPQAVEELTARCGGWAAGLKLVHLSTPRGAATRPLLSTLAGPAQLVGPYLARNVLAELPEQLRDFVRATCALGLLTGALCDRMRDGRGSAALLHELHQRQICSPAGDVLGAYRYAPLLQSHLEQQLEDELGARAGQRYRRAAALLEETGGYADAVRASARAADWATVRRLLHVHGEQVAGARRENWQDVLPRHLLDDDPWLLVASARREYVAGRFDRAMDLYDRAEQAMPESAARQRCRSEREMAAMWSPDAPCGGPAWYHRLRDATRCRPLEHADRALVAPDGPGLLVAGLATLLAGRLAEADRLLARAAVAPGTGEGSMLCARLGRIAVSLCETGHGEPADIDALALDADLAGLPWLARMARSLLAVTSDSDGGHDATLVRAEFERDGDLWGALVTALLQGVRCLSAQANPAEPLERAVKLARQLDAGVLEAWARSLLAAAMAFANAPEAELAARGAESCARAVEVESARGIALLALANCRGPGEEQAELRALARQHILGTGISGARMSSLLPWTQGTQRRAEPAERRRTPALSRAVSRPAPPLDLRLIGGFTLRLAGREPDLSRLRPRARTTLRLLALHAGRPVHRETLVEALWPHLPAGAGMHSLQVAVSALRRALDPGPTRGSSRLLARNGDAYTFVLPEDGRVDVLDFARAVRSAREVRANSPHDPQAAMALLRTALRLYRGDLLPEDGPAEWVVDERERLRHQAGEAAATLGALELRHGDPAAAATALEQGLRIDPFRDGAWRLLISAYDAVGDVAAAMRTRRAYSTVLAELGVHDSPLGEELHLGDRGVLLAPGPGVDG